ncbi:M15 family metallopeptidase [Mesonia sp. K7]|uniref:M15 family metallopeptidase n=1 Tax=Mesonia sp. K7 TaxID=2218606 RepID=UPI000DA926B5|nr:M15 family metallopeptidase [Mesonia sp. K7]PZD79685.1 D-alanyl-D-alanine carboxypeptidase family protein [Mesonia sp. K7]
MNRKEFLQRIGFISALASLSFSDKKLWQETYTQDQLTGKTPVTATTNNQHIQDEVYQAFSAMKKAAAKENIDIQIVSGYRSFERQLEIWNGKYQRFTQQGLSPTEAIKKILEYSTIPGTSRHHWGTDIDIIDGNKKAPETLLNPENYNENGVFCDLKVWMNKHAERFGFYEVYTNNPNRKGFFYEPWHFSYKEVSSPMLEAYKKLDFKTIIRSEKRLLGNSHLSDEILDNYFRENILDINPALLS